MIDRRRLDQSAPTVRAAPRASSSSSMEDPNDGRGQPRGQGTTEHRLQSHLGQVTLSPRSQRTDAADLDADRGEVGETAQRVGRDDDGPLTQQILLNVAAESSESDEFVE